MTAKVILNPYAGRWNAAQKQSEAEAALTNAGIDYELVLTKYPEHGFDLATQAVRDGYSPIISAGGDGSVNEVVNGIIREMHSLGLNTLPPLGILPLGSVNDLVVNLGLGPYFVVSLIILAFMILGCFMEGLSIMVLAVPIVYPIVVQLGFDPIWFGIIITLTMEMSLITPPVGVNVFVLSGVAKDVPMYTIFRGILPFWLAMVACIILLMIFPQIVLFLPNTMM